jgi:glyoxylate reductase
MAAMARVLFTRPLPQVATDLLERAGHHVMVHGHDGPLSADLLGNLVAEADGMLCTLADRISPELLAAGPNLRAISVFAVGFDNVDLAATAARGIAVGNTPDVLTDATADLAMALLLAAARQLPQGEQNVRGGMWSTWEPLGFLGLELAGARLCIVGAGRIGRATGHRAEAFGMQVEYVGRTDDLRAALARADVVSLHAPHTPQTAGMIDAAAIAAMKPGAILVNTARGTLIDQVALREALVRGHLGAAALDVTDPEPLPPSDPLLTAPNLIVLPHIGSATVNARNAMAARAAKNLIAGLAGEPMPWAVPLPS